MEVLEVVKYHYHIKRILDLGNIDRGQNIS